VLAPGLIGTARAVDQPPETAPQQRAWLLSHLVTDMQSVGSFTSDDIARMVTLVNTLTDDQASLLARFYFLTREKTEQDASLYAVRQTEGDGALAQAKAQVAELLAQLQSQIQQTYSEVATINPGCETLCQIAYASVPGWCAYNQYAVPDWYYSNGCYVGPCYSANYCGAYAVPVYQTFYNRASRYNYWSSRNYFHNNIVRIGSGIRLNPVVAGTHRPHSVTHNGAVTANHNAVSVPRHDNPLPKANHAPNAVARHNAPKRHDPAALARNHAAAPTVKQSKKAPHAVAHNQQKPAAHPRAQAHVAQHPQHVAHAAQPRAQHAAHAQPHPHPQHVAQAHSSSGHARRK
jgi:hypothetical protein